LEAIDVADVEQVASLRSSSSSSLPLGLLMLLLLLAWARVLRRWRGEEGGQEGAPS